MTLVKRSLLSELRALLAAARKEWIIFRRYPSWVVAFFIWPFLGPLPYILFGKALGGPDGSAVASFSALAGTTDYASYVILGITIWMWLNMTLWDLGFYLRNEQMRGTLESNWLCPTWRLGLTLGASLTKLGTASLMLVATVVEYRLLTGLNVIRGNVWLVLLILLLTMPSVYGIALAFASLVMRFREANAMVFAVRGIFMIFCGLSYPIQIMPMWMQRVAAYLPLTYTIEGIRRVALADATLNDILPQLLWLILFAVLMPVAGYLAFRFAERRSRRTGALGQY